MTDTIEVIAKRMALDMIELSLKDYRSYPSLEAKFLRRMKGSPHFVECAQKCVKKEIIPERVELRKKQLAKIRADNARALHGVNKLKDNYNKAKRWFREKEQKTFGYYWCLEHSEFNPNVINKFLVDNERLDWNI